jgi:hypothetical protein
MSLTTVVFANAALDLAVLALLTAVMRVPFRFGRNAASASAPSRHDDLPPGAEAGRVRRPLHPRFGGAERWRV